MIQNDALLIAGFFGYGVVYSFVRWSTQHPNETLTWKTAAKPLILGVVAGGLAASQGGAPSSEAIQLALVGAVPIADMIYNQLFPANVGGVD